MIDPYAGLGAQRADRPKDDEDDLLSNGFRRSDYNRRGINDDIEMWGLDQFNAPSPDAAGWVVWDMVQEIDW